MLRLVLQCLVSSFLVASATATATAAAEKELPAPKVLLLYDLEGLTDVTTPGTTLGSDGYERARESLVEDVNAAIGGLLEAGALEVVLVDGHGSGNSEPDYPLEHLPRGARHEIPPYACSTRRRSVSSADCGWRG